MRFRISLIILLLVSQHIFAGLTEKIEQADKDFNAFLETVDDALKTDLKKKYNKKKQEAIKKAKEKAWEKSKEKAEKYMKKYGSKTGNQLLNSVTKQKKNIEKGIQEALKVLSGDAEPEDLYAMSMKWGADKYLKTFFPSIGIIIEMSEFAKKQLDNLVDEIYETNMKTMAKRMLKDKPLFELTGKQLNDYLLNNYVDFGKKVADQDSFSEGRDLLASRSFFTEYGKREKFTHIGLKDEGTLYKQKRDTSVYLLRHFLQTKVFPIHKSYIKIAEAKKQLKKEVMFAEELLEEPTQEEIDDEIGDDFYRYIEPWIIDPKNRTIDMPEIKAPNSKKEEKDRKKREKIKKKYRYALDKLNNIKSKKNTLYKSSKLNRVSIYWYPSGIINYYKITLPDLYNKKCLDINLILNKLAYNYTRQFKSDELNWTRPDIGFYLEKMNTQVRSLNEQESKLNSVIASQISYINELKKLINEVESVAYVGLNNYDQTIYRKKQQTIEEYSIELAKIKLALEYNQELPADLKKGFNHFVDEDLAFKKATISLDKFTSKMNSLNSSYKKVISFTPVIQNINSLVSERINYQLLVNRFLSDVYDTYKVAGIDYPYSSDFDFLVKTNIGFIENSYESYFRGIYFEALREAEFETNLSLKNIRYLKLSGYLLSSKFPFYKNRTVETTQAFVDNKRLDFEQSIQKIKDGADKEKELIKAFSQAKKKYFEKLNALVVRYNKQHTFNSNSFWTSNYNRFVEKTNKKEVEFNLLIKQFDEAYTLRMSRLSKEKIQAIKLDAEENDRIFKYFSNLRLGRLAMAATYPEHVRFEMKQAKPYFDIYIITDIGKAKTLYLYFYSKLLDAQKQHEEVEILYLEPFHKTHQQKAAILFSDSFDYVMYLESQLNKWEALLMTELTNIKELKDSVSFIDNSQPVMDVVYGKLDSDSDGVPDNIELATGTDPINGVDTINSVTLEVTIPAGQGVVFESGQVGFSPSGDQVAIYGNFGMFGWSIHGENYIDMTGEETVPNHNNGGYSIGGFINNLNPGKVYAMYYPSTQNYVKIEIISHSPGNEIKILYTINIKGELF